MRKKFTGYILFLLAVLCLSSYTAMGQLVTIDARLDTNQITIGDQLHLTFRVVKPANAEVIFPTLKDTLADGAIDILNVSPIDSSATTEGKTLLEQKYLITAFDSGLYYIRPFPFVLKTNNITDTIFSRASYLDVHTVPIDSTGVLRDIKGIEKAPVSFGEIYPYLLLAIFAILAVWFIMYYFRKRKKQQPIFRRERPPEPAHVIAIRELDKLKAEKLWQQQQLKQYYSRLTEIVRTYIERRFHIKAMEQTTDEILTDFRNEDIDTDINYDLLRSLLNLADLVKFAKQEPLPDENVQNIENAYTFVKNTMYREPEPEESKQSDTAPGNENNPEKPETDENEVEQEKDITE